MNEMDLDGVRAGVLKRPTLLARVEREKERFKVSSYSFCAVSKRREATKRSSV